MGNYEQVKKSRHLLKERLVYISGNQCCICGYNRCLQALEFHHLDPAQKDFTISKNPNTSFDKAIEEIKKCILVCANCHREIHADLIKDLPISSFNQKRYEEIQEKRTFQQNLCVDCGEPIDKKAVRCRKCYLAFQRKNIPEREILKKMIREKSFAQIGREYNMSINGIKKWCIIRNLPFKKADIRQYSFEEWEKI